MTKLLSRSRLSSTACAKRSSSLCKRPHRILTRVRSRPRYVVRCTADRSAPSLLLPALSRSGWRPTPESAAIDPRHFHRLKAGVFVQVVSQEITRCHPRAAGRYLLPKGLRTRQPLLSQSTAPSQSRTKSWTLLNSRSSCLIELRLTARQVRNVGLVLV